MPAAPEQVARIKLCHDCPARKAKGTGAACPESGLAFLGHAEAGECPLGLFAGLTVKGVAHGVVGLAKAAFGIDRAGDATIEARRATCAACPEWTGRTCKLCGCLVAAKIRLKGEACPAGKWGAVTDQGTPDVQP